MATVPPEVLPDAWQPLLAQPPLARLLGQPIVDEALLTMHRLLPPRVAVHSLRTFLLADACARARGTGCDRTGLLVAAAFHDTGLTRGAPRVRGGFPTRSAALLDRFLVGHGVAERRRGALTRAVREHMRPFPARDAGPEARLLHFAAWLDVVGRGGGEVPGERRRLAALAPTPLFAVSFSARVAVSGLRGALPDRLPPGAGRRGRPAR
ncbi:HD domain-containing protein [Streptomyces sp. NPDC006997]|uniref:HD domain-containing protein n=1 Tax=Streptomyces sp. NPDC006997 TaxID=3155356 RepID=UPI0033F5FAD6